MTTINTPDDLLRLVREDDTFREAMRRELLTVELLEAPQRIANIEQSVTALIEHANATNARLDRMDQILAAIVEQTNAINRRLDLVERDINGLGESFRREVRAQSSFRGNYAQTAASASDIDIAHLFAHRHGLEDIKTRHISRSNLEAWLRENRDLVKSLDIRQRATRTFLRPDIIASVNDLYSADGAAPVYYIVIEASYTGDTEDVDRATDHAKIVRAVTGLEAYAVVAAVMLDDEMEQATRSRLFDDLERFVDARDENGAYWHQLYSADLKPPEPR